MQQEQLSPGSSSKAQPSQAPPERADHPNQHMAPGLRMQHPDPSAMGGDP